MSRVRLKDYILCISAVLSVQRGVTSLFQANNNSSKRILPEAAILRYPKICVCNYVVKYKGRK